MTASWTPQCVTQDVTKCAVTDCDRVWISDQWCAKHFFDDLYGLTPQSCAAPDCARVFEQRAGLGRRKVYCTRECGYRTTASARDLALCAGTCGRMIPGSSTSRPEGERICNPCRRAARGFDPNRSIKEQEAARLAARPTGPIGCANMACQVTIENPKPRQKWCSQQCRHRVQDVTPSARQRWIRKNTKRRPTGLATTSGWAKLRAQVLAEESACWICTDPIDPDVKWPAALAGTADHVVPIEDGGAILDRSNVRAAHNACNRQRHVEWRRARRAAVRGV